MSSRRVVLTATASFVVGLAILMVIFRWDSANKIAVVVSALAAVAAVGVAIWAALPVMSSDKGIQVSRTGRATAGSGGHANTGFSGPANSLPDSAVVDQTGEANASNGKDANSGIQLS
jgi:hypothetical protein